MSRFFGETHQLGLVVRDFDAALREWTEVLGIGPFYTIPQIRPEDYRYRGAPAPSPLISLAFGHAGDLQIEIIAQHDDHPSGYLDFLNAGREGAHHICSWYDRPGYEARHARLIEQGFAPIHEGAVGGLRFCYFDTDLHGRAVACEISESGEPGAVALFAGIREEARRWDGSDPVRLLQM